MTKNRLLIGIPIAIAIIFLSYGFYSYYLSKLSVMTTEKIEFCDEECNENEICNNRRQICSNRTNENIKCSYVGDNKCHQKCNTNDDCDIGKCVPLIFCLSPPDICDIDGEKLGIDGNIREVKICQQ